MNYKSAIDYPYYLILILSLVTSIVLIAEYITSKEIRIVGWIFSLAGFMYVLPLLLNTRYTLLDDKVNIKCGFFLNINIKYEKIISIAKTMKRGKAGGLSMNRVLIKYYFGAKEKSILISPKYRDDFIRELNSRIDKHLVKSKE